MRLQRTSHEGARPLRVAHFSASVHTDGLSVVSPRPRLRQFGKHPLPLVGHGKLCQLHSRARELAVLRRHPSPRFGRRVQRHAWVSTVKVS